jgi:hypothetical protein
MLVRISRISILLVVVMLPACDEGGNICLPLRTDTCYVVDQANYESDTQVNLDYVGLCGQEFLPTQTTLDIVKLRFSNSNSDSGSVFIRIRIKTIIGPVLGTSKIHNIKTDGTHSEFILNFFFSRPIPVIPGNRHVIEVIASDDFNLMICHASYTDYSRGRAILRDGPRDYSDLWFETGRNTLCFELDG